MPDPYARVRISGILPGGEKWSTAPAFIGNFATTPFSHAELQTWATAIGSTLQSSLPAGLGRFMSNRAEITQVRCEMYGANGRLADYAEDAVDPTGGITGLRLPDTSAVVLSLYTGLPGRRTRGRMYWPALGATLDTTTGRFAASDCQAAADGTVTLLSAIEEVAPGNRQVVAGVWSTTNGSGVAVTQVRVGDVPDTMRSRKDALTESYASAELGVPAG